MKRFGYDAIIRVHWLERKPSHIEFDTSTDGDKCLLCGMVRTAMVEQTQNHVQCSDAAEAVEYVRIGNPRHTEMCVPGMYSIMAVMSE